MNLTLERLSRAVMSVSMHESHTRAIFSYVRSTLLWQQALQTHTPHTLQWWRREKKENLRRQHEHDGHSKSGIQTGGMMSSSGGSKPDLA
jgi:cytolysin (calcineurin-like family phosphatase)